MRASCFLMVVIVLGSSSSPVRARDDGTVSVLNHLDSGPGSFRAAIRIANSDPSVSIVNFAPNLGPISLLSSVEYTGSQYLRINGEGAVVDGSEVTDVFVSSGGASLKLKQLTLQNGGGEGVYVPVSSDTEGEVFVELYYVTIRGNGLHGLHIDDLSDGGSDASIRLKITYSSVYRNGFEGDSDYDGVRVDEAGLGGISAVVNFSNIDENGADGLELDERGPGGVSLTVKESQFVENGPLDPADLDDGVDIDEADEGGISVDMSYVNLDGNFDEGLDLDEAGEGDLYVDLFVVSARGNGDENLKFDEEDGGYVYARLQHITATDSGNEEGISFGETGDGPLVVLVGWSNISSNADDGLQLDEEDEGYLGLLVQECTVDGNQSDGIKPEELSDGDFIAKIINSDITGNGDYGIDAEQEEPGVGHLLLQSVVFGGNASGPYDVDGIDVIEAP